MDYRRLSSLMLLLIAMSILLPITACVVLGVAALLQAMGDSIGGGVLRWIALGCGILWIVNLICLVLVQAVQSLDGVGEQESKDESE